MRQRRPADGPARQQRARRAAPPDRTLEFQLVTRSLTSIPSDAWVLGAFENVEPAGAALAVDALFDGAIGDLTRRRVISARAGEVFIAPLHRQRRRVQHVVFAGLGDFSAFTTQVLQQSAANVARTLALCGIRRFATVLWGTASGISVEQSIDALASGFLQAAEELAPAQRPTRITIAARSKARLSRAAASLERVLAARDGAVRATIRHERRPADAVQRKAPAPTSATSLAYLMLQQHGDELQASLLGTTAKATALVARQRLDTERLEKLLLDVERLDRRGALAKFGTTLGKLALPATILEALPSVRDAALVVVHDAETGRWPWETLHVGDWAPARTAGLLRRLASEDVPVARWQESRRLDRSLRVLLIVDPTEDLPGAAREGRRVRQLFAAERRLTLDVLEGAEATARRVLDALASGRYDAVHYAGHAFFDVDVPGRSGLMCAGGRVLGGNDLAGLEALPALVFFNACESGRLRQPGRARRELTRGTSVAESLLRGGIASLLGTWWPVGDEPAAAFATAFYRDVLAGASLGTAVASGRQAVVATGSHDWANYLCYGSHDFRLKVAE